MFCTKCGAQIPDDSAFCTQCGSVIEQDRAVDVPPEQQATSVSPVQPLPADAPTPGASEAAVKRNVPLIVGVSVAAVVAAIVIVVLVVRFAGSSSVKIDESAFPDNGLRSAISAQADADGDGVLSTDEAEGVTELSFEDVSDIAGQSTSDI